jgi:hypothetical protein
VDLSQYLLPSRFSYNPTLTPGAATPWITDSRWEPVTQSSQGILLPACHNADTALLLVERFMRDDAALDPWAAIAKRCIEFVEGKQWSAEELQAAADEDRPTLTLNKIAALVRLVLGYHRNNRVDTKYLPTNDLAATDAVAMLLSKIAKNIATQNEEAYVDTEVFLDGIIGARGYFDFRMCYEKNDFGDIVERAKDPFTIRPDADGDTYDPNGWGHVSEARWVNLDEVEYTYGRNVSSIVEPLVRASGYRGGIPSDLMDIVGEKHPWRTFGGQMADGFGGTNMSIESYIANSVDTYRKNIRLVEMQHYVRVMQWNIVDLETGDREPIPTNFKQKDVVKIMAWSKEQYDLRGQPFPLRVERRPTKRVRWTTMIGDIVVYDGWSPHETFTIVPFFPYFRRGMTRGMVEDLIDPQVEVNKRRSAETDITTRTAHAGWMWHVNSLEETEKEKIENFGAAPGINIEYKGDKAPEQIKPPIPSDAMSKLEEKAVGDLKEIAGINDSALGQLDRVQSGRAIESRQRQSVLGIEPYMDNFRRSKKMCGKKKLELIQNNYTEPRLFRIEGPQGGQAMLGINQVDANGEILNNVTLGRYDVAIDETPLSATYLNAQFEELMDLIEKGILPIAMVQDIAVDLSNAPQKDLIKKRLNAYLQAQGLMTPDQIVAAQDGGAVLPQVVLPAPQPHGVPDKGTPPASGPGSQPAEGAAPPGVPPALMAPQPNPGLAAPRPGGGL